MRRRHATTLLTSTLIACLGAIACSQTAMVAPDVAVAEGDASVTLTISAAASVQEAMQAVQAAYQTAAPEVTLVYNFGSSGSLAQQIHQGAPTDVFLSASTQWMDDLETKEQIRTDSRQDLLQNTMVLIVPRDQATVMDFQDLTASGLGKVAIGEPESAPVGRYAKEVLTAFNLFETLQPRLVFAKDVRQVLSYVATGNVDAGLVYATDAMLSDQVEAIATAPPATHTPIVYPIAIVQNSPHAEAAQSFLAFLTTPTAVTIFEDHGFTIAP
ncbi:MAG: molybdate ABC transporter substrate-binding protein [Cyanobacteria bacterium J06638_20]